MNAYVLNFLPFGENMRKIMIVKKRKCLQNIIVEMY
jgi:hypothetical protein